MKKVTKLASIFAASAMLFGAMNFMSCSDGSSGGGSGAADVKDNGDGTTTLTINENDTKSGFVKAVNGEGVAVKINTVNVQDAYSGSGYLDSPAKVIYSINSEVAQDVTIQMKYAHWGWTDQIKVAYVQVNGKNYLDADKLLYGNHTGKKLELSNTVKIPLNAGDNQLCLLPVPKGTELQKYDEAKGYGVKYPNGEADETKAATDGNVAGLYKADGMISNLDYITITGKGIKNGTGKSANYYTVTTSVNNSDYGKIEFEPAQESYIEGTEVTVKATANEGYVFDSWCGSSTDTTGSFKVTINGDKSITARFIPSTFDKSTLAGLEGYASICDDNGTAYTVTGGFGGQEITLSSVADIEENKAKISGNDPYIIKVDARITTTDNKSLAFDVGSNKTLIGEKGQDFGFKNINPKISGENVIVKNLHFGDVIGDDLWSGTGNDALSIKGGKHIWIDHCEFSSSIDPKNNDGTELSFEDYQKAGGVVDLEGESTTPETKWKKDFYDGLLDVSELSRFVSVSNCYFHDHWKACLCGGSNDKAEQQASGSLVRLTMYNNYFNNIHARQPLFRFGKAHIYSSYLYGADDASGIEVRAKSEVYVDNVYFENFKKSVGCWNSSSGDIGAGAWTVKDCDGIAADTSSNSTSYVPPYTWTKTSASDSRTNLPTSAGIEK